MTVDVAVIGGGVIGLSVAWRCAQRGLRVRVLDPAPGLGASHVSAGMLAPVGESVFGEAALSRLLLDSAARWPAWAAELTAATGVEIGYRLDGTLTVALTPDDLSEVERLLAYQTGLGLPIEALGPSGLRLREPLLTPRLRGGALAPDDRQADPRRLVLALRLAAEALGVRFEAWAVTDLAQVAERTVVVAAGCGTAGLTGLPVRPVKGQILRLRAPGGGLPGIRHVIRGYADGRQVYLVPRAEGEVVVGATAEESGDRMVTAGAVLDLLRSAVALVPDLAGYELVESGVGHRPGTPDNGPIVGWLSGAAGLQPAGRRIAVAAGHFRHGIILTPATADGLAELITTGELPEALTPFGPDRFASAAGSTVEVTG